MGLVKQCIYKATVKTNVTQKDLEQIILDTEIILDHQQMMYTDDDIHLISSVNTKYTATWTTYSNPRKANRER